MLYEVKGNGRFRRFLAVEDDGVALGKDKLAVRYEQLFAAPHHNDERLAGNVDVLDGDAVPVVVFPQRDLAQIDRLVALHMLRADDEPVPGPQRHVAAGDDRIAAALDDRKDHALRQMQLAHRFSPPEIAAVQLGFDEVQLLFLGIVADPLEPRILLDEARGNDTGGDRHHADAEKRDENAHRFPGGRDGVDVAVADGEQRGHRPPHAGESVFEHLRLRVVFERVHTKARTEHQHEDDEHRREQLLFFADDDLGDDVERIVIRIDAEQPEDPRHAEQPERRRAGREEHRQVERQERESINDAAGRQNIFGERPALGELRVQAFCRQQPENIVQREKGDRDLLHKIKQRTVGQTHAVERVGKRPDEIDDQHQRADNVVPLVDRIIHHAHGYHF